METYIHYGHKNFERNLFLPIQNGYFLSKPTGGLWASNIKAKWGWKDWCKSEHFRDCNTSNSFSFTLSNKAKILRITSAEQLKLIPQIKSNFPFLSWVLPDFEELAKEYDAIEVYISYSWKLYCDLYGWDCDSILIMNPDIIKVI